ncbi:SusD/RagB family nutrient-binding outer membrane lipoprotein [Flavitalea sp. BT771]|uniref:SusD/RagB family nutrient-binding outer membrane lipoprotein n=1 Tax=Flavitalea sp. BT771 TaxID=3063329 RepID=UPI0026E38217|nr:SusD/RagB family nutrient-binding outer membrane lipoprotein [Flavitalea sp. BT771]MDO6435406.1 SusD/RagB family nutrient-binding outer membrane lipoprotein [Flavitalea sp. BT771]MDV6224234.1 SusD/RagB family nutrient-binding outer membrane lipoprotein [Flavitalea sp. BT771]
MNQRVNMILNSRLQVLMIIGVIMCTVSCTKNFEQINTDKNTIPTIGPLELPFLFSRAEEVATTNAANYQIAQNLFADQYCQYFACEATYFPSDRLVIRQDWVGANFNPIYSSVLPQLLTIFSKTDSMSAEHAMAEVLWVFAFHKVTDYWGPIPYFKAGQVLTSMPYDAQDKIYDDFFKRLTDAVAVLKTHAGGNGFASYDLIYGGDVDQWVRFANTLRLRLALRISKVDPARAKTEAEAAVASGVMTKSPNHDAFIKRSANGDDNNGLSIMSDWNEFRMSATMASVLKGYQDPRISEYFLPTVNSGDPTFGVFSHYSGLRNGLSVDQLGLDPNLADANSHTGARWASTSVKVGGTTVGRGDYVATSQNVIEAAEAYFLRAEGKLLGWDMGGGLSAQQLYEAGITNSMNQWGIIDPTAISAYINSPNKPIPPGDGLNSPAVSTVPIAWHSDPDTQRMQIATQKWLALYPDGMEAWADWRRSHVMPLYEVVNSDNPLITNTKTQWIRRIPFLDSEKSSNAAAVTAAKSLLGGDDNVLTPLWWDKN